MTASDRGRPRLGVFKLASCDGCQLTLLDCEDELLALAGAVEILHFPEVSSRLAAEGPFDLVLLEGSVSTEEQRELVHAVRARTPRLVAIGACATAGGIQALRNFADHEEYVRAVYARPEYVSTLATATPASEHVRVDFELRGCPIDRGQLLELLVATLLGRKPQVPDEAVCMECKRRGQVCVMVARGEPCLGPVTHAGCGALCPAYDRGCYGCFGPKENPNPPALSARLSRDGASDQEIARRFRVFTGWAGPFREESLRRGR